MAVFRIYVQFSNDHRARSGVFVLAAFAAVILLAGAQATAAQTPTQWVTDAQEEEMLSRLRAALPQGSVIAPTISSRTPDDWNTLDHRGFEIDGQVNGHNFQIWFLPPDWLGIRMPGADGPRAVYSDGIFAGPSFKVVTKTEDAAVYEALWRQQGSVASLVNGGMFSARFVFEDRIEEVDEKTQALVRQFCHDRSCRDAAAHSLIILGVPARSVIFDCAEHGGGIAQEYCVSTLVYWKWSGSLPILLGLALNPDTPTGTQKVAAMALGSIADPSSGEALTRMLRSTTFSEAAEQAAEALARIRYEPAAPAILSRMEREPNPARFAQALASLQYKPAIAPIEMLCNTRTFDGDWILAMKQRVNLGWLPEAALMRLTGAWGPASGGIRLLLLPPGHSITAGSIRTAVVIENVGDTNQDILGFAGQVIVDGKTFTEPQGMINGNVTLRVNDVFPREIDLSKLITTPGEHRIEYRFGTATSNTLVLRVP